MPRRFIGFLFVTFLTCVLAFAGCRFGSQFEGPLESTGAAALVPTTGNADVRFDIELPPTASGLKPAILAAAGDPTVTIRLILINAGNTTKPTTILSKTSTVVDGSATVMFSGVPPLPVIGEIQIASGSIGGHADFHGAADLKSGANTLVVAPLGSGLDSDLVAGVLRQALNSSDTFQALPPNPASVIRGLLGGLDKNAPTLSTDAFQKFLENAAPGAMTLLAWNAGTNQLSFTKGTTVVSKSAADLWNGTSVDPSTLEFDRIFRHCIDGAGLVGWKAKTGPTSYLMTVAADGSRKFFCRNAGPCRRILLLGDGSVVAGGANVETGRPVLFHWKGNADQDTARSTTWTLPEWRTFFDAHEVASSLVVVEPEVAFVQLLSSNQILCGLPNPVNGVVRRFRVPLTGSSAGTPVPVALPGVLALGANPGNGFVDLRWDALPNITEYRVYHATTQGQAVTGGQFVQVASTTWRHTGLTNGTTYYYQVVPQGATEVRSMEIAARPIDQDVPPANRAPLATATVAFTTVVVDAMAALECRAVDPDGDPLAFLWTAPIGTFAFIVPPTGFAPNTASTTYWKPNATGTYTLSCMVSDGKGGVTTATVQVTAVSPDPTNRAPLATATVSAASVQAGAQVTAACAATDPDNDTLSYVWTAPSGSFGAANASATTWTAGSAGTVTLSCAVSDGKGGTTTATVQVTVTPASVEGPLGTVGAVASFVIGAQNEISLPTPSGQEEFVLAIYPLNTASANYQIQVNGGGAPLASVRQETPLSGQVLKDLRMRELDRQIAPQVRAEYQRWLSIRRSTSGGEPPATMTFKISVEKPTPQNLAVEATRRYVGTGPTKCTIYTEPHAMTVNDKVQDAGAMPDALIQKLGKEFDEKMFPFVRDYYGDTWDKDGDGFVTIFISSRVNNDASWGWFTGNDFTDNGNNRDMFYCAAFGEAEFADAAGTLVHEFQHLVNYVGHNKGNNSEDAWVNESLAVSAEMRYRGVEVSRGFITEFTTAPGIYSLVNWGQKNGHYGITGMFMYYMFEQLGSATLRNICQGAPDGTKTGVDNINTNAEARGGFENLFKDWTAALIRYGRNLPASEKFDYKILKLMASPSLADDGDSVQKKLKVVNKTFTDGFNATMQSTSFAFVGMKAPTGYSGQTATIRLTDPDNGAGKFGVTVLRTK